MDFVVASGLVAMACFMAAALFAAARPKPDPSKPKFVVATMGCMGCLFTLSVILGVLSSAASLVVSIKRLMQ